MWSLILLLCCPAASTFADFGSNTPPPNVELNHTTWEHADLQGRPVAKITFQPADWPNVLFRAPEIWDWSDHAGIAVELYNPGTRPVAVNVRVDNASTNGDENWNTSTVVAPPGVSTTLRCRLRTGNDARFWGMRGIPESGPLGTGATLDPRAITAFQIFLDHPSEATELLLSKVVLFGDAASPANVPFPFVDPFGQYEHDTWPGKLTDEGQLSERAEEEARYLWPKDPPRPQPWPFEDRDRFGGWSSGPELEATGWFRSQEINGKWWLVTPSGRLFLSVGMDCVGHWQRTFVTGREDWFAWLPPEDDEAFGKFYAKVTDTHSMAEQIGGGGTVFGFYSANLLRKHGAEWNTRWRETSYRRLQVWGFNTLGNWSQSDVIANSPLPYVVSGQVSGVPPIAGASGYWARMFDVYDPAFVDRARRVVDAVAGPHAGNPLCIGYFIDNELAWDGVINGVLRSPGTQPARKVLLDALRGKYATLEELNAAWGTGYAAWDEIGDTGDRSEAMQRDLDDFLYGFARTYFQALSDAFRQKAPNQLYLGCRFSNQPDPVIRACADFADVISFNRYETAIDCAQFEAPALQGKPVMIGEFHFGALDRGMFHGGLVPVEDQEARGAAYREYWRSVADCPAVVGAHWFQYVDEPLTGRHLDGENYNIGFVDVTDTPYPELRDAAIEVHSTIYERRYRGETP